MDIFTNYALQREELLARIAQELQLDKTRKEKMESAYNSISVLLKKDETFFQNLDVELYAQCSKRIGTTVKPINGDDFDLDVVMHIYDMYINHSPGKVYNELLRVLINDGFYSTILEKKSRCIRLNYRGDFHMDILPACMAFWNDRFRIAIPEKQLQQWSSGNPKGYAEWFSRIADTVKEPMLRMYSDFLAKAQVESEPLPEELYYKTPLQRAVQLIKRSRDVYYQNRQHSVSSIVLTTLMAKHYNGEESIFESIDNITQKIQQEYTVALASNLKFKVLNPVDENEDFTDSWTTETYESFSAFISDFYRKWQLIKKSFDTSGSEYVNLFGEGIYKKSLQEQIKTFSKSSQNQFTIANGLILRNSAFTNPQGVINSKSGIRNEPHHNFGA